MFGTSLHTQQDSLTCMYVHSVRKPTLLRTHDDALLLLCRLPGALLLRPVVDYKHLYTNLVSRLRDTGSYLK